MPHPAWILVFVGIFIVILGLVWLFSPAIPWPGRLPGDIVIERENFRFFFPITTCILLSLVLTGIIWLARSFSR